MSLSQLACSFPEEFPELRKLSNPEDSALDVFHNLVHLQPHRQAKGLMQIKRAIEEGDLGEVSHALPVRALPLRAWTGLLRWKKNGSHTRPDSRLLVVHPCNRSTGTHPA